MSSENAAASRKEVPLAERECVQQGRPCHDHCPHIYGRPAATSTERTIPMQMRGTPADAPTIRRLFDAVAVNLPMDDFGQVLYEWTEEVTRLLEVDRGA